MMKEKPLSMQVVDQLLSNDNVRNKIFAVREMNCFVVGIARDVSARYNKVLAILPESEPWCGDLGERCFIKSKHNRPSIIVTRYQREYMIHLFDGKEYALFLEGISCKNALLHVYDLVSSLVNIK